MKLLKTIALVLRPGAAAFAQTATDRSEETINQVSAATPTTEQE